MTNLVKSVPPRSHHESTRRVRDRPRARSRRLHASRRDLLTNDARVEPRSVHHLCFRPANHSRLVSRKLYEADTQETGGGGLSVAGSTESPAKAVACGANAIKVTRTNTTKTVKNRLVNIFSPLDRLGLSGGSNFCPQYYMGASFFHLLSTGFV